MKRTLGLFLFIALLMPFPSGASEAFSVAAKGAVLIDADSGRVLFGQNENVQLPMASTTKVMTALLALEHARLDEPVTAGPNASGVPGTSIYLAEGETLSMEHMLYGLMLRSGNDAAVAIAEHVAGSVPEFAAMMNARAAELGADAHYVNPHGLDAEGHQISALGLARVMRAALAHPEFRAITGTRRKIIPWVGNEYSRVLENKNRLLKTYEGIIGGKTGFTSRAGRCLVFAAERDDLTLIGAVLNCPTWFDTATRLLDYGFESFRMERACEKGDAIGVVRVENGLSDAVSAVAGAPLAAAVAVGSPVEQSVTLPERLQAPIRAGQALGTLTLKSGGIAIAQCPLVAAASGERRSLGQSLRRLLVNWLLRLQASATP